MPEGARRGCSPLLRVEDSRAGRQAGASRLAAGAKLPLTRKSEAFFGVSRNTAAEVYERLLNDGYLVSRHGSGTYVADRVPASPRHVQPKGELPPDRRLNAFWLRPDVTAAMSFWRDQPDRPSPVASGSRVDFRPALVDSRLFPFDVFRQVSAKQLRRLERKPSSFRSPRGNQGNYFLRDAIVKHIALTRAFVCQPEDILVTSGAHQACSAPSCVRSSPSSGARPVG